MAVASPGPDFFIVLKRVTSSGRAAALATSLGIACGIAVHCLLAITGITLIISKSPIAQSGIQIIGSIYLIYLGMTAFKSKSSQPISEQDTRNPSTFLKTFFEGLSVNLLNVKATLFFLALFSGVIADSTPMLTKWIYGAYLSTATLAWFSLISILLDRRVIKYLYLENAALINRTFGIILIFLGLLWCANSLNSI